MRVFIVLMLMFPVISEGSEIILACKGKVSVNGSETGNNEDLTVHIDTEEEHLRVDWGPATMIDNKMFVHANEYSYAKLDEKKKRIDRRFSINRTTLEYEWGVYVNELNHFHTSSGSCSKIDPKI